MANDSRSAYDRALGVTAADHDAPWARYRAIRDRIAEALQASDWPAVQAYAMLLIAEQMPSEPITVHWQEWQDHASTVGGMVASAIGR